MLDLPVEKEGISVYKGKQSAWDRYASIRSRPRRYLAKDIDEFYFPHSRQPLCAHPLIVELGKDVEKYILIQSAYKFMHEIAMLETEMVNVAATKVANNRFSFQFPDDLRQDAITVVIDEAYHAFVAIDFMKQIEARTGIKPIAQPVQNPNTKAIELVNQHLTKNLHDVFQLIAVCISEHTLTKELINIGKEGKALKSFSEVMSDHVLDEGRHAMIFSDILTMFWQHLDEESKCEIGKYLPLFIREYLNTEEQIEYDRNILRSLNLPESKITQIINDTHIEYDPIELKNINPIIPNLIKLLEKTHVLSHMPTREYFIADHLL